MKHVLKTIVRLFCFLICAVIITAGVAKVLNWKDTKGIDGLYAMPKDRVDAAIFGSSHVYCSVDPVTMWDRYGIAARSFAESGQMIGTTQIYLEELLKTQHPRVVLIDLFPMTLNESFLEGNLYRNTLNVHPSARAMDNIRYALSVSLVPREDWDQRALDIFLKYPVFHSRYKEITREDFLPFDMTDSNYVSSWSENGPGEPESAYTEEVSPVDQETFSRITAFCDTAQAAGADVLFYVSPYGVTDVDMSMWNGIEAWCAQEGIVFINFCKPDVYKQIRFDWNRDFMNEGDDVHQNTYGAMKISALLADTLHEHYDLPDRRGEKGYEIYQATSQHWAVTRLMHDLEMVSSPAEAVELLDGSSVPWMMIIRDGYWETYSTLTDYTWAEDILTQGYHAENAEREGAVISLSENVFIEQEAAGQTVWNNRERMDLTQCHICVLVIDPYTGKVGCDLRFLQLDGEFFRVDEE